MVSIKTTLSGIELDNPIIPASGTFAFGEEFKSLYDLNILGSLSFKGTTVEERPGNALPRIAECPGGMLNSVGLQNPGVKKVVEEELPRLGKFFKKPLVANISGFSLEDFAVLSECISRGYGLRNGGKVRGSGLQSGKGEDEEAGLHEIESECDRYYGNGESRGKRRSGRPCTH